MIMVRLQVKNIMSSIDKSNLGSVVFANSYFWIEPKKYMNLT